MSQSVQTISLAKPPTRTEKIVLKVAKILFWWGVYVLAVVAFLYTGTARTIIMSLKQAPPIATDIGRLTVNTKFVPSEVKVDEEVIGKTPLEGDELLTGSYLLTLTPTYFENFLMPLTVPIRISEGSNTIVQAENGVNYFSSGYLVVYSIPSNMPALIVHSVPTKSEVKINGQSAGQTPYIRLHIQPAEYQLQIIAKGYETVEIPIKIHPTRTTVVLIKMYRKILQ